MLMLLLMAVVVLEEARAGGDAGPTALDGDANEDDDVSEAVWSQTLAESIGCPTITPHTPAVYPARTLFNTSVVMPAAKMKMLTVRAF